MEATSVKSLNAITAEWDSLCTKRQKAIDSQKDVSLLCVTAPFIENQIQHLAPASILDVGCGTGYLTSLLAKHSDKCIGLDASSESIALAKSKYLSAGLEFICTSAQDYAPDSKFEVCVSCMALSCDPNPAETLNSIRDLLEVNGRLFIMIPHPCFWPKYWNLEKYPWFNYNEEVFIQHDFSMSFEKNIGTSTFVHRPLSTYFALLNHAGFSVNNLFEPYPVGNIPEGYRYDYPRFLFIDCEMLDNGCRTP